MFSTFLYFIGNMFKKYMDSDIPVWILTLFMIIFAFKLMWSLIRRGKF